ncbi:MAG: peptidoglycan-N-acetylglucosamine deacetylase [Solirubrobacteraceae bacterium]|nr:peptidoglycan-N-acetylglucosamine deacetylase [Solirubrobacteraceae bacterium]
MIEPPLHRRRRLRLGAALAVVACVLAAVGALDGGSTTKPAGALAHGRPLHPAGPPARSAVRLPLRERLLRQERRTVDAILRRDAYVSVAGRHRREMALTFDDGPGPYTLSVVRVLRHLDVPATFFQVGFSEHWFTDAERAEVRDPHFIIGDHTENHPDLDRLSAAAQAAQIDEQAAVVRAAGAPAPRLFRPPYGEFDATTLALLRRRHMLMVLWTVDSQDYRRPGIPAIVRRVLSGARPGAIVLMHDAGGVRTQTIAALPRIVGALRRRHFRLVTVPRLLHDDPPPVRQPRIGGAG